MSFSLELPEIKDKDAIKYLNKYLFLLQAKNLR